MSKFLEDDNDFSPEGIEYTLATYSKSGKLIDTLYIAGGEGQDVYKYAFIDSNLMIETKEYTLTGGDSISEQFDVVDKKYQLNTNGFFVNMHQTEKTSGNYFVDGDNLIEVKNDSKK